MNGSRRFEHRSDMPKRHWLYLVALAAAVALAIFLNGEAEAAVRGEAGVISNWSNVCQFREISPQKVDLLEEYSALMTRLHAAGGYILDDESMMRGIELEKVCGQTEGAQKAHVILVDGDFILVEFDTTVQAGFFAPYLTRASNFTAGQPL